MLLYGGGVLCSSTRSKTAPGAVFGDGKLRKGSRGRFLRLYRSSVIASGNKSRETEGNTDSFCVQVRDKLGHGEEEREDAADLRVPPGRD